ncbi:MAG: carboxypeptidase regulatory-like domain-containing protein [Acidobacteriota bacterium]|nr:carboxypeptidase regulatory-like domain-containing protein [Acidobacteriota bacterium]
MIQKLILFRIISLCLLVLTLFSASVFQINAQSQALNGQIEGTVTDAAGAAVPNASITVRNIEKGSELVTTSDENGVYRAPLLPLGTFRITAEAPNFKRLVREGITLSAGQTATVDLGLEAGDVSATVTISSDAPIADPGKIDVGRVMNTREIQDLPLVSRNPYNFSLLQANVVGRPNTEFGVPRVSANGYARRTNFQLDGNANTQANQAGLRLVPISETFISEVQLVTNGFSAEFGNTPGLIMNNITPSGTNGFHGSTSYRFRRTWMSSRPFNTSPLAVKPPTTVDDFTVAVGGPIIKDRWHFYGGYEYVTRDFSGRPAQVVTISETNRAALVTAGLDSSIFVPSIPASQKVNFFIFRTDVQLTEAHRLTGRYIKFTNFSPNNVGGGLNTLQRTVDLDDKSNSLAIQLASIFTPNVFNEFRYQRANRKSEFLPTTFTPTNTPSVLITGVAAFGPATNTGTISPIQTMNQFQDNLTWTRGDHSMKFGGGLNRIYDYRRNDISALYTFPNIAAYVAANSPTATAAQRRGYTSFAQTLGDAEITYNSTFYNLFAQDDWKVTRKLKLNYGLRYDLYDVPEGDSSAPIDAAKNFKVDKNNIAPRLGAVYALRDGERPTVIRGSAGIYYDTVYLVMYENAIQGNGTGRYLSVSRTPTQAGAPLFPNVIAAGTTLGSLGITQNVEQISPDFKNMYAMHFQAQIEQAITNNLSVTAGYIHSNGRHLPVYSQTNCLPIAGRTLADGRPVYGNLNAAGTAITPCVNRINPLFNNIITVDSGGNSVYDALTLQLNKRFSQGYQFSFNYTLSRARDNAPERNLQGVTAATQSDPSNRDFDWAYGIADQRHTFSGSFVARPSFDVENGTLRYLLNNNQFGFTAFAGSGETYPINTNFDLNGDGVGNDIPVGYERNGGRVGRTLNVDFRYSRVIPITERFRIELIAEATNIFNINSTVTFGGTAYTTINNIGGTGFNTTTGVYNGPFIGPTFTPTAQESRQGQFGIKFIF